MSLFIEGEPGFDAVTRSPKNKKDVLKAVKAYRDTYKALPTRVSFIVWDPIDVDFLFGLQQAKEDNTPYFKNTKLHIHECIPSEYGAHVEILHGKIPEGKGNG